MNIYIIILLIVLPVAIGFLIIWLSFKNINKKYQLLFIKLAETARTRPKQITQIIKADEQKGESIVSILCSISQILNVEILKAGKTVTKLHLKALINEENEEKLFYVELTKNDTWLLSELYPLQNS